MMNVNINHYHYFMNDQQLITKKLDLMFDMLDAIHKQIGGIRRKEETIMKEIDDLIVVVEQTRGVSESTAVAIDQILAYQAQILSQIENTVDPEQIAVLNQKLRDYNTALAAKKDALLAAIPATPAP